MNGLLDEIRALIETYGFEDCAEELLALAEPTVGVRISRTEPDSIARGASRFGGVPDLPASVDWPTHRGRQLTLIAQLRLDEFGSYDLKGLLPRRGWLCFFLNPEIDPSDEGETDYQVLYFENDLGSLGRRQPGEGVAPFHMCRTELSRHYTLPDHSSKKAKPFVDTAERWDLYGDLLLEVQMLPGCGLPPQPQVSLAKRLFRRTPRYGFHQVLGYPERDNLDPETIARTLAADGRLAAGATETENSAEWILLLEVTSDDDGLGGLGVSWGTDGRLLFIVRRQDLLEQRFDAVELVTTHA